MPRNETKIVGKGSPGFSFQHGHGRTTVQIRTSVIVVVVIAILVVCGYGDEIVSILPIVRGLR